MRPLITTFVAGALAGAIPGASLADTGETHSADLIDARGGVIGEASVTEADFGLLLDVRAEGLEPGLHGVHLHAVGDCSEIPSFASAGEHIANGEQDHGLLAENGPHDGDLANIFAGEDGKAVAQLETARVRLRGAHTAFLDRDGGALIVHAGEDDHVSADGGGSGERVACAAFEWTEPPEEDAASD